MQCSYYDAGLCRSCTIIEQPYSSQLHDKEQHCRELLSGHPETIWLPSVMSAEAGYRNKAKMVVGGTAASPTLGILDSRGEGIDLRGCGILMPGIRAALPALAGIVAIMGLEPYDVPARRGELKYLLVTEAPSGELMIRFVVRSEDCVPIIRGHLDALVAAVPAAAVVSVNIHPEHKAVVEGRQEVVLTRRQTLTMDLPDVALHLRPQSFFQTNTAIAAALYDQARQWSSRLEPSTIWDLYCGVGGFALHLAAVDRTVVGVEVSDDAITSARQSALDAGLVGTSFLTGDATAFAREATIVPDLVVVNPPRRGIGAELAAWLERSGTPSVIYSSCNPVTLAKDLEAMPGYAVRETRVLDMFPQTTHLEVMALLERTG